MASFLVECLSWLIIVLFSLYIFQLLRDARRRLPPGPWPPKPLVGDLLDLGEDGKQHRTFQCLAARYGGLMCLRFGMVPHVVVCTADALRAVMFAGGGGGKKVDAIAGIPSLDVLNAVGHSAHTIFSLPSQDDKWRAIRKFAVAEMLAPRRISGSAQLQARIVEALHREVSGHAARGDAVVFKHVVLDSILSLLLGLLYTTDLEPKELAMFRDLTEEIVGMLGTTNVSDVFPAIAALDLQGLRRRTGSLLTVLYRQFDEQFALRLRSREAGEPRKNDVLDTVLDMDRERSRESSLLSHDVMRVLLCDLYGAGGSSTAALVEWGMADLIQHPEVMSKVKEELARVLGDKPVMDESDIARLPYLHAVVKEILRLRTVLPLVPRKAEADIEVNGYRIPRGTNVILNAWAINRDAAAWPEPDRFMPERFVGGGETRSYLGQDFDMVPFGVGRRICPGMQLALKLIPLIFGTLLHRFEWELPAEVKEAGIDMTEKCGVVLSLVNPLKAIPKQI
ncbi:cytochrome P450 76C2-like [Oryza brachyantha]|uniref:Cytochrome P450 family protein n=1 Tax=Oryza brachyantha TaxID=4533 RepID=J3MCL1_ORYBR|nr:cytochrome P450 76C2-like [Oryza brachyantha]